MRMGGAELAVDVGAVGLDADGRDVRAEFREHVGRHRVGGAVGAVDDDLQTAQVARSIHRALAELDVAPARVVDAERPAKLQGVDPHRRLLQQPLDGGLPFVRQLVAFAVEQLDAVVLVAVVRAADDDAGVGAECSGEVRDRRRRHRAEQADVDSGRYQAGFQHRFDHVAGDARVLADHHLRGVAVGQRLADGPAQAKAEVRGDRRLADAPANAIGAEEVPFHAAHAASLVSRASPAGAAQRRAFVARRTFGLARSAGLPARNVNALRRGRRWAGARTGWPPTRTRPRTGPSVPAVAAELRRSVAACRP